MLTDSQTFTAIMTGAAICALPSMVLVILYAFVEWLWDIDVGEFDHEYDHYGD